MVDSPVGRLFIADGPRGILAIHFMDGKGLDPLAAMRGKYDIVEDQAAADRIGEEIRSFIAGDHTALKHQIDFSLVESDFKRRALMKLCKVPLGSVVTYQALASAIGAPDGQRAVGNAMGSNPIPIYVPCHRVIKSDLSIGNYGGGVDRKLKLLRAEGFAVGQGYAGAGARRDGASGDAYLLSSAMLGGKARDFRQVYIYADSERARGAGLRACKLCHPA